jgi:hypothetical protein
VGFLESVSSSKLTDNSRCWLHPIVLVRVRVRVIRHQVYQSLGTFPARHIVAQNIEKQELTKALEEKILPLAWEHGGKLNAILRGSNTAFKQAKDRFLGQLEEHLRAFVLSSLLSLALSPHVPRT